MEYVSNVIENRLFGKLGIVFFYAAGIRITVEKALSATEGSKLVPIDPVSNQSAEQTKTLKKH